MTSYLHNFSVLLPCLIFLRWFIEPIRAVFGTDNVTWALTFPCHPWVMAKDKYVSWFLKRAAHVISLQSCDLRLIPGKVCFSSRAHFASLSGWSVRSWPASKKKNKNDACSCFFFSPQFLLEILSNLKSSNMRVSISILSASHYLVKYAVFKLSYL